MKLPRNLDHLVESGRHGLEDLVETGRRGAGRVYADGRDWIADHLPDRAPSSGEVRRGAEKARRSAEETLRSPVAWVEARLPEPRRSHTVVWPSVLAAGAAGVAFWWWTSWARGRAEAAERAALDAAGGAEGRAHPEQVMAHNAEPAGAPSEAPDTSASKLTEPAEDIMAHAPPPPEVDPAQAGGAGGGSTEAATKAPAGGATETHAGKATADEARLLASTSAAGLAGGVAEVAPSGAVKSLDESLAVQGAATPTGKGGAKRKSAPNGASA